MKNNPSPGSLDNATENDICKKAAQNGYLAAIVQYRKTPGDATTESWNTSAQMIGEDYDKCIVAIAGKYGVDKSKSVVGGYSYASNILFTNISIYNTLSYCKGVLAACGGSGEWNAQNFKIPFIRLIVPATMRGHIMARVCMIRFQQIPLSNLKVKG
ncbi:dienelactone hydrolase [Pedobacter sp. AK017]|uniref:hypothetical protein n=1 Tax=Pedobacter sp. AK017 TaxID=2723073 RepID=UPI0018580D3D|nr:hypothetical protein [Pedobacter sp. AK017]MBB5440290.1 dienelactone hydrolase [Pedobacter sp. AK017]